MGEPSSSFEPQPVPSPDKRGGTSGKASDLPECIKVLTETIT